MPLVSSYSDEGFAGQRQNLHNSYLRTYILVIILNALSIEHFRIISTIEPDNNVAFDFLLTKKYDGYCL